MMVGTNATRELLPLMAVTDDERRGALGVDGRRQDHTVCTVLGSFGTVKNFLKIITGKASDVDI